MKKNIVPLERVLLALYEWSGITDDTPDDTEILNIGSESITLSDLRDAFSSLETLKTHLATEKPS